MIGRRALLRGGLLAAAGLTVPGVAFARAETDRRFVFVILRGAMDGLNVVVPYADPDYVRLRGPLAVPMDGEHPALRLDGTFALHPALARVGAMYGQGQAAFVHAVASPYRERSHFDGQNVLESGGMAAYALKDGWLNRLLPLVGGRAPALAVAATVPMALRGAAAVTSYAPSALPRAGDDLIARVARLYEADAQLHPLWDEAMAARMLAGPDAAKGGDPAALGRIAATFLAKEDGPRIATIELGGWDTHAGQAARLAGALRDLDAVAGALADGLGAAWGSTVVLAATEFGRTAAANGTGGTDHGTGTAALVLGGAVKGGRVVADWPGLGPSALLDGRDLRPTTDLRSVILGVAAAHLGVDPAQATRALYPGEGRIVPVTGLV